MRGKKIFIITIALLLIIGTGSFVFAGDGEELDVDNRPNNPTNNIKPIQKDDTETKTDTNLGNDITTPTIPNDEDNQGEDNPSSSDNTNNNINNNGSSSSNNSQVSNNKPSTSNPGSTTKPSTPVEPIKPTTPDVEEKPEEQPTEPITPVTPPTPEDPISKTLEVKSIVISNNNGYKKTIDPISVQITFNEPVSKFENVNMGSSSWDKDTNTLTIVGITENKKHIIKAYDEKGKYINVDFETKNYFSDEPIINTVVGSDGSIKLVMSSNKEITDPSWTKEDDGTYTKAIDKFEDCDVVIIDGEAIVIPYTPPATLESKSDNQNDKNGYNYTNKATITIKSITGKELEPLDGWELSEDRLSISKIVYENVKEKEVTITDIEGNKVTIKYSALNVNSEKPQIEDLFGDIITVNKEKKIELDFITKPLKYAPVGWTAVDKAMREMIIQINDSEEVPVTLFDIWGNEAFYYVSAKINKNKVDVTQRDATEDEITKLKEKYNLN